MCLTTFWLPRRAYLYLCRILSPLPHPSACCACLTCLHYHTFFVLLLGVGILPANCTPACLVSSGSFWHYSVQCPLLPPPALATFTWNSVSPVLTLHSYTPVSVFYTTAPLDLHHTPFITPHALPTFLPVPFMPCVLPAPKLPSHPFPYCMPSPACTHVPAFILPLYTTCLVPCNLPLCPQLALPATTCMILQFVVVILCNACAAMQLCVHYATFCLHCMLLWGFHCLPFAWEEDWMDWDACLVLTLQPALQHPCSFCCSPFLPLSILPLPFSFCHYLPPFLHCPPPLPAFCLCLMGCASFPSLPMPRFVAICLPPLCILVD